MENRNARRATLNYEQHFLSTSSLRTRMEREGEHYPFRKSQVQTAENERMGVWKMKE